MRGKANAEKASELKEKKRPGRRPMTAEEKEAAAKLRAAEKEKADHLKPELILAEAAKADFRSIKKRTLVTSLKLYVKPEEQAAYYVINGDFTGKVSF